MSGLLDELKQQVVTGNIVVIAGTGVSIAASRDHKVKDFPVARWDGLLQHGIWYCKELEGVLDERQANLLRQQVELGDTNSLLSVAEQISRSLRARREGSFNNWLQRSVGVLPCEDPSVARALGALGGVLATLNYDGLLEAATGRRAVTWRNRAEVEAVLRGGVTDKVVHLHGHYEQPDSIVLGFSSYDDVAKDEHAAAVLQSFVLQRTLLFVGCGGTMRDPNFQRLIDWASRALRASDHRHYLLCTESERDALRDSLKATPWLYPIVYGAQHSELFGFLGRLKSDTDVSTSYLHNVAAGSGVLERRGMRADEYRPYPKDLIEQLETLLEDRLQRRSGVDGLLEGQIQNLVRQIATSCRPARIGDHVLGAELIEVIGSGNFGHVWRARPLGKGPQDDIAIKIFQSEKLGLKRSLHAFRKGVVAMERLAEEAARPPEVIELKASDESKTAFAMNLAKYLDLDEVGCRDWELERILRFFRGVCTAVRFAHQRGIRHRDIKPKNVLVGAGQTPILTDFDIADLMYKSTLTADSHGTPHYAAPEQLQGNDSRELNADIYSLGRLLHYMLLGKDPPWEDAIPKLRDLADRPEGLVRIIRKCTMREPAARYQNVDALLADLERYADKPTQVGVGYEDSSQTASTSSGRAALHVPLGMLALTAAVLGAIGLWWIYPPLNKALWPPDAIETSSTAATKPASATTPITLAESYRILGQAPSAAVARLKQLLFCVELSDAGGNETDSSKLVTRVESEFATPIVVERADVDVMLQEMHQIDTRYPKSDVPHNFPRVRALLSPLLARIPDPDRALTMMLEAGPDLTVAFLFTEYHSDQHYFEYGMKQHILKFLAKANLGKAPLELFAEVIRHTAGDAQERDDYDLAVGAAKRALGPEFGAWYLSVRKVDYEQDNPEAIHPSGRPLAPR